MNNLGDLDERLNTFKQKYKAALPVKISGISFNWSLFCTEWQSNFLEQLITECHTLADSSSTFGFISVSQTAREIETNLNKLLSKGNYSSKDNLQLINEISLRMMDLIETVRVLNEKVIDDITIETVSDKRLHSIGTVKDHLIYYLDGDFVTAQVLTKQLVGYGFRCLQFDSTVDLLNAIQDSLPSLVMLDLPKLDLPCSKVFELAESLIALDIKVFILSNSNDFVSQLSAVRVGVHACIEKHSGIAFIVSKIRSVLQLYGNRPSRILIVDDQRSEEDYYAVALRDAGMIVQVETTPSRVLCILNECIPDLVILDLNMASTNGLELAAVIRQYEMFQSVPIVFLSATEMHKKNYLLELGVDILVKHEISLSEFVIQIKSRVSRSKALSSTLYRDSLTGLLNHAHIQHSFEKEFLRSKRYNSPLTIAMIDIDKLKIVNDTYGHFVGDKVILALSNLLDQRLRSTDSIGRFGGEEFLVIMPDCNVDTARIMINKLRIIFSELKFEDKGKEFSVSFSAGISGAGDAQSYLDQLKRADDALYQAKTEGRNIVFSNYAIRARS